MSTLQFADYLLTNLNNGSITIEIKEPITNKIVRVLVPNFDSIIKGLVLDEFSDQRLCAELFNMAFSNDVNERERFISDSRSDIIGYLDDTQEIPGQEHNRRALGNWHLKEFTKAYNKKYNTNLNNKEIELYCQETLNSF